MLPEKIYYPHDFPLTITIAELNEVPLHYHLAGDCFLRFRYT